MPKIKRAKIKEANELIALPETLRKINNAERNVLEYWKTRKDEDKVIISLQNMYHGADPRHDGIQECVKKWKKSKQELIDHLLFL